MRAVMYANPAPTNKNVRSAQANLEELQGRLQSTYQQLQQGAYLNTSEDGVRVISGILRYISDYNKRVDNHINVNSEPAPIKVPDQFTFGFEKYFQSTRIPEGEIVPKLDKQRQILSYILDKLINSARVPGAIDTLAFQVKFTGYTPTLRKFLNNLAYFQLPVVVRSVEVNRLDAKPQGRSSEAFGNVSTLNTDDNKTPVISEIESIFTVTLEFIEVIISPDIIKDDIL